VEARLDVDTPEGVVFGYQIAGIGSRFIAALIDTFVLAASLLAFVCGLAAASNIVSISWLGRWLSALAVLFVFALTWGYYIFFELVWNGQSPGKRWVGLRVIRTDGTPVTLVDSLIRNLVRAIDFLPLYYVVGLVTMFSSAQARRLGDYAAGTLVVKERRDVTLESLQQQARRLDASVPDALTPLDLSEQDYVLITDFLDRRDQLRNRDELAQRIAAAVAAKLGLPQPSLAAEAEDFLIRLASQARGQ
jgi:uncharacterized RDD family membrane protein YckC